MTIQKVKLPVSSLRNEIYLKNYTPEFGYVGEKVIFMGELEECSANHPRKGNASKEYTFTPEGMRWAPRPGPLEVYDKDNHLLIKATIDYLEDKNGSKHLGYVTRNEYPHYIFKKRFGHKEIEFHRGSVYERAIRHYDANEKLISEITYYRNGNVKSLKYFQNGNTTAYNFYSISGKRYDLMRGKTNPQLWKKILADSIDAKITNRTSRKEALKKILKARRKGFYQEAQRIRHKFDQKIPKETSSIIGRVGALLRYQKRTRD